MPDRLAWPIWAWLIWVSLVWVWLVWVWLVLRGLVAEFDQPGRVDGPRPDGQDPAETASGEFGFPPDPRGQAMLRGHRDGLGCEPFRALGH